MISASSATKIVYVNGSSGNDHNSGSSWKYAKATLQNATNTVDNKGTVYLADGTYKSLGNTKITVDRNMSIIGQSRDGTIIDGTKTKWFFNVKSGSNLILKYLTLQNGYASDKSVILNNGTLNLNYCKLTKNSAIWDGGDFNEVNGGAIYNNRTLILNNIIFTKNSAENGGAIYNNEGTVTFNGYSIFNSNQAIYGNGGAIRCINGTVTFNGNSIFTNNTAEWGGAISSKGKLIFNGDSTFNYNNATGGGGGAISNFGGGTLKFNRKVSFIHNNADYGGAINNGGTITLNCNSSFTGNHAVNGGGAIINAGIIVLNNANLTNNTASYGGAINNGGKLTLSNANFMNNTALGRGGAINNGGIVSTVIVHKSSFKYNTAFYGGAINNYGIFNIYKSTFSHDTAKYSGGAIFNCANATIKLNNSVFTNNQAVNLYGGAISNEPDANVNVHFSSFYNTADYGGIIDNLNGSVNATHNWWGNNNPNFESLLQGIVDHTPWLYMKFTSDSTNVNQGDKVLLNASFNYIFNGKTVSNLDPKNGHIPDNTPVTFSTTSGTIGNSSAVNTRNGVVSTFLNASKPGTAIVKAITNDQVLNLNINVNTIKPQPPLKPVPPTIKTIDDTNKSVHAKTVGMQKTGIPILGFLLAILMLFGGFANSKPKK